MRKLILIAVLVVAALAAGIAYVVVSDDGGGGERRAGALAPSYATGKIAVQLDGVQIGFLRSARCGAVSAPVVRPATGESKVGVDSKNIGAPKYEPCELEFGLTAMPAFNAWMSEALKGTAQPKTLNLQYLDQNFNEKARLELQNASLIAVAMPNADSSEDTYAYTKLTVAPQAVRSFPGSGAAVSSTLGTQKSQLVANFRFTWSSSTLAYATEVDGLSFTIDPATKRAQLDEIDFVVAENEPKLSTLDASFKKFLIDGQNTDANETSATLEWLTADLKSTTATLSLQGVGWAAGELVGATSADGSIAKRHYTLYVERASFSVAP